MGDVTIFPRSARRLSDCQGEAGFHVADLRARLTTTARLIVAVGSVEEALAALDNARAEIALLKMGG
ncbi:MAG: hypothetical protein IPK78_19870 [Rhodospirillales bacterium]|nr:hypothetical protein [Rhodospirillales bacterium]